MTLNFKLIHRRGAETQRKTNSYFIAPAAQTNNIFSASLRLCVSIPKGLLKPRLYSHGNGKTRLALQTARLLVSIKRNLRRHQRLLGLRPAGRRAQTQRQGGLVALGDQGAGRHGRPGRRHPDEPQSLGNQRPRGEFRRPSG